MTHEIISYQYAMGTLRKETHQDKTTEAVLYYLLYCPWGFEKVIPASGEDPEVVTPYYYIFDQAGLVKAITDDEGDILPCQWRFKIMHDGDLNLCKMGGELFQNCANRLKMNSIHPKRGNTAYDKPGRQKVSYRIAQAWTSYRKDCYPLGSTPQFRQYNFKRKERAISYERIQFDQS